MKLPLWKRNQDHDLEQELCSHFEMAIKDRVDRGESRVQAEANVRREFGNELLVREATRRQWGWLWVEQCVQDLRYGARMLIRNPGFTAVTLITIALGICANTAIFSVVNALLVRPLPYPNSEQLVTLHLSKPNFATGAIPFPTFRDWQRMNRSFDSMALSRANSVTMVAGGESEYLPINLITSDFFRVLGVKPVLGRHFVAGEDDLNGPRLVEISEGLWKRKFGAARDVIGKTLKLDSDTYTIVGVVPALDLQLGYFEPTDVYLPMGQWGNSALRSRRAALGLHGIGRIKSDITLDQARADMQAVSRALAEQFPDTNRGTEANLIPLRQALVAPSKSALLLLLAAVIVVMLIVCVNVASLLLARAQSRSREFAIRDAVGASRFRIIRQLLTESLLLSVTGAVLGVVLAHWVLALGVPLVPEGFLRTSHIEMDWRVLAFSVAVSLMAGITFGLAPALRSATGEFHSASRGNTRSRSKLQRSLVTAEVSAALILLIGAGLLFKSLVRTWGVDPGFEPHNVAIFGVGLAPQFSNAPVPQVREEIRELEQAMATLPRVSAVSIQGAASPMRGEDDMTFWPANQPAPQSDSEKNWTLRYIVQPGYLDVMKIPLLRGRFFTAQDTLTSPPVVVVDDVFASTFYPHDDAIGKRVRWDSGPLDTAEIVGIVGHVNQWGLGRDDSNSLRAQMYQSFDQLPDGNVGPTNLFVARTTVAPSSLAEPLKNRMRAMNAENVTFDFLTMDDVLKQTISASQFTTTLLSAFASLALLLACVGLYGLISYSVGQRTHEFGIRMALGATKASILQVVMREAGATAALGVAIGIPLALGFAGFLRNLLFSVSPSDPLTFASVALVLMIIALLAAFIPARRAMNADPAIALRQE